MKTCPTCGARAFDDAEVCYGCLHRYDAAEGAVAREPCGGMGEMSRADLPRGADGCAAMRPDIARSATRPEVAVASRPESASSEPERLDGEADAMGPRNDADTARADVSAGRFDGVSAAASPSASVREPIRARAEAAERDEASLENRRFCSAAPPRNGAGWVVRFELPGYAPVLERDEREGGLVVRFQPEEAQGQPDRRHARMGHGTHARDAPAEGRALASASGLA